MGNDPCEYCDGELTDKKIRLDYRAGTKLVAIENITARVCVKCGERYYDAVILKKVESFAKRKDGIKKTVLGVSEESLEDFLLSYHPEFRESIESAYAKGRKKGGTPIEEVIDGLKKKDKKIQLK